MLTKDEAEARVAKGAAHLDEVRPGWFNDIDTGTLTLSSCQRCVLGQFSGMKERYEDDEGPFLHGLSLIGLMPEQGAINAVAAAHGFAIRATDGPCRQTEANFALLQDAWIAAIAARRCPVSEPAHTQPVVSMRYDGLRASPSLVRASKTLRAL